MSSTKGPDEMSWEELVDWSNRDPSGYMGYLNRRTQERGNKAMNDAQASGDFAGFHNALTSNINAMGPGSMAPVLEALKLQEERTGRQVRLVGGPSPTGSNQLRGQSMMAPYKPIKQAAPIRGTGVSFIGGDPRFGVIGKPEGKPYEQAIQGLQSAGMEPGYQPHEEWMTAHGRKPTV